MKFSPNEKRIRRRPAVYLTLGSSKAHLGGYLPAQPSEVLKTAQSRSVQKTATLGRAPTVEVKRSARSYDHAMCYRPKGWPIYKLMAFVMTITFCQAHITTEKALQEAFRDIVPIYHAVKDMDPFRGRKMKRITDILRILLYRLPEILDNVPTGKNQLLIQIMEDELTPAASVRRQSRRSASACPSGIRHFQQYHADGRFTDDISNPPEREQVQLEYGNKPIRAIDSQRSLGMEEKSDSQRVRKAPKRRTATQEELIYEPKHSVCYGKPSVHQPLYEHLVEPTALMKKVDKANARDTVPPLRPMGKRVTRPRTGKRKSRRASEPAIGFDVHKIMRTTPYSLLGKHGYVVKMNQDTNIPVSRFALRPLTNKYGHRESLASSKGTRWMFVKDCKRWFLYSLTKINEHGFLLPRALPKKIGWLNGKDYKTWRDKGKPKLAQAEAIKVLKEMSGVQDD